MDVRQAEYLKLLGIQAWCKQEDLTHVKENVRLQKSRQDAQLSTSTSLEAATSPNLNIASEHPIYGDQDRGESIQHTAQRNPSSIQSGVEEQSSPNFAANTHIDADRFSAQLKRVTEGLRVDVNPKKGATIAVKSAFEPRPFVYPVEKSVFLSEFAAAISECLGCDFSQARHKVTLPRQSKNAPVMVITDIPLKEEMFQGRVLDPNDERFFFQAMSAVGLMTEDLYITPFIKCRPPELRDVSDTEWQACFQVLKREIEAVNPQVIFLLGRTAVKFLLQKELPFETLRLEKHHIVIDNKEYPVVISHSPKVYAKNSRLKANFWQDVKFLRRQLA